MNPDDLTPLQQDNLQRKAALEMQGMQIPNEVMLTLRLETLIELLVPAGTPEREELDLRFDHEVSGILDQAEAQLNRAKLTSLHIPGNGQG